jgi:zinc transport system ATP-binding protein
MPGDAVIDISDLTFAYNGQPVLRDVSFTVGPNEQAYMVGPNGGGKTTLLKLILGLLEPQSGSVRVLGVSPRQARPRVGYTPQTSLFDSTFPVSVLDVVLTGALGRTRWLGPFALADRRAARAALDEVGLGDLAGRSFSDLSGGQRQRVLIARALVCRPELLLLDEPMANLDVGVETRLNELLTRLSRRMSVLVVSHDVGFVSASEGKVICVQGTVHVHPTAALTGQLMRDLYGQDIRLVRHDHNCPQQGQEPHSHE